MWVPRLARVATLRFIAAAAAVALLAAAARPASAAAGTELLDEIQRRVSLHGYVHTEVEKEPGEPTVFELDHAVLRVDAMLHERLQTVIELLGHASTGAEGSDVPALAVLQAYGALTLHGAFALRAGQMLVPFGLQDQIYYCPRRLSNHHPLALQELGLQRWAAAGVVAGGQVSGQVLKLRYELGLFNGPLAAAVRAPGLRDGDGDSDSGPMPVVRLGAGVGKHVRLGLSSAWARDGGRPARSQWLLGAFAELRAGGLLLQAEGVTRRAETEQATSVRLGYYAQAGYWIFTSRLLRAIVPLLRIEGVDAGGPDGQSGLLLAANVGLAAEVLDGLRVLADVELFRTLALTWEPSFRIGATFAF